MAMPAAPATMMAEISNVPCSQTANADSHSRPCWAKNVWNEPSITPFWKRMNPVPKLVNTPMTKAKNDTLTLFRVISPNIESSGSPS